MSRTVDYLNCPHPQHRRQLLMSVCVDANCPNRSLVCYLCEKDGHLGHNTKTLEEFLDEVDTRGDTQADSEMQELASQSVQRVEAQKNQCLQKITEVRKQLNGQIDSLEKQAEQFFQSMANSVQYDTEVYLASTGKGFEYCHKKRVEKVLDEFRKCLKYYHQEDKSKDQVLKEITGKVDKSLDFSKQIELMLEQTSSILSESLKKMQSKLLQNCFTLNLPNMQGPRGSRVKSSVLLQEIVGGLSKWSPTLKHPDISVQGCIAKRHTQSVKCKHVCVAVDDIPFIDIENLVFNYRINVNEKVCGIIIGMCLESKIKESSFVRDDWARNRGHGHYLIGDDGMTWSHSDVSVNYKMKSFRFTTGDVIDIEFEMGRLNFTKNLTERWEMDVVAPPKGDCYRLCAYLFMKGDAISLLEYK